MERYKVFIIDDNVDNLKTFINIFEHHCPQYDIFQTNNPKNAIEIASKVNPQLIVTDWDMPNISGIEVIHQLKSQNETKNIPIIMATGVHITSDDLKVALEAGAIDFIRKPIDPIELVARTHSALMVFQYQKQVIETKDQELTESSLYLVKSHKFNLDMTKRLDELTGIIDSDTNKTKIELRNIIKTFNLRIKEDGWYRFDLSFDKVHKDFNRNLLEKYGELTSTDLKLCAFIRLGMNNKDIASVLNQNPDSVKVSRSRLRKKLAIDQAQNLEAFLAKY
ncbi:MAG: response regulator [Salinivirgaceae bacterium]|jgi:DNA-binding response OmpR family regulator/DNA-binding CsgD family transcriptional regulator|nr:response regulator [Salinivirgaceae bacterium]